MPEYAIVFVDEVPRRVNKTVGNEIVPITFLKNQHMYVKIIGVLNKLDFPLRMRPY